MLKASNEIKQLRAKLDGPARRRYGTARWVRPLAREAGWNPRTLENLFLRGQRLPPADKLAALEAALGLTRPASLAEDEAIDVLLDEAFVLDEGGLRHVRGAPDHVNKELRSELDRIQAETKIQIEKTLAIANERMDAAVLKAEAKWKASRRQSNP